MNQIKTVGLGKALLLRALINGTKEVQSGKVEPISVKDTLSLVTDSTDELGYTFVEEYKGIKLGCYLNEYEFNPVEYDANQEDGAAYKIVQELKRELGIHHDKMYSEGNIIDLIKIGYLDVTDERPIYRIIFEEGKGFAALGVKPDERKIDLGEFFTKMYTEANISNDIKIKSSSPNYFDIEIPGFSESGAFCIYNDLLEEIKRAEQ